MLLIHQPPLFDMLMTAQRKCETLVNKPQPSDLHMESVSAAFSIIMTSSSKREISMRGDQLPLIQGTLFHPRTNMFIGVLPTDQIKLIKSQYFFVNYISCVYFGRLSKEDCRTFFLANGNYMCPIRALASLPNFRCIYWLQAMK